MTDALLVIDVVTDGGYRHSQWLAGPIIVVEPLYGSVAVALALDAGWDSVVPELEEEGVPPIPLVSFEQVPPEGQRVGGRCLVRGRDLHFVAEHIVDELWGGDDSDELEPLERSPWPVLLGSVVNARPLASMIARACAEAARVTFLTAPSVGEQSTNETIESTTADASWASGMLIRVLLEEIDGRSVALTDAAGIAVTVAQGAEDPGAQLSSGVRWRRHIERGGHPDDLRLASAVDSVGVVPELVLEDDDLEFCARVWQPA